MLVHVSLVTASQHLDGSSVELLQTMAAMWAVLTPAQYAHLAVGCPAPVDMLRLAEMLAVATGHTVLAQQLQGECRRQVATMCLTPFSSVIPPCA
jgi:hypothetical protein